MNPIESYAQPGTSTFPPGHPDAPPAPDRAVIAAPAGLQWEAHPVTGERRLTYAAPEAPAEPAAGPAQPDVWPKRLAAGGLSTAAIVGALGYAGPGLSQAGHAVEMGGVGVGIACAGLGAVALLVKGSLGKSPKVEVNVNVTNHNTASARAKSRRR